MQQLKNLHVSGHKDFLNCIVHIVENLGLHHTLNIELCCSLLLLQLWDSLSHREISDADLTHQFTKILFTVLV